MNSTSRPEQAAGLVAVNSVMHRGIVSCRPSAEVREVAGTMAAHNVHCVVIIDEAKDGTHAPRVWGIVSDLDVMQALARPDVPVTAADLAHEPAITVRTTLSLREVAAAMAHHRAHHLVVVGEDGHTPVGVVSTLDLAAQLANG